MCEQELRWIRKHSNDIESKAKNLYLMYIRGDKFNARERCVDFPKLEKICEKYNKKMVGESSSSKEKRNKTWEYYKCYWAGKVILGYVHEIKCVIAE